MNRLQSELRRLYFPVSAAPSGVDAATSSLVDGRRQVRAMVLALARPADWALVSQVWRGVQADLALPAPAIAVSGTDAFQLWFSLSEPVSLAQSEAFLASLRLRYLPDVAAQRLSLLPVMDPSAPNQVRHAPLVPARQEPSGDWSAFVAPDLAPVFADTPWLDIPPGDEGQAELLRGLRSIAPADFAGALERLRPTAPAPADAGTHPLHARAEAPAACLDPKSFLLQVMNDDTVSLALRIEAAKALLPRVDLLP